MSEQVKPSNSLTNAFSSEQSRIASYNKVWLSLVSTLKVFIDELNEKIQHSKIVTHDESDHELKISYLGRELVIFGDACEQKFGYELFKVTSSKSINTKTSVASETGSFCMKDYGNELVVDEGTNLHLVPSQGYWPVAHQLSEQLISKLAMPGWKDDRFIHSPH